ncbi:MAG TPA: hypothetical protein VN920_15770 [Pyrinomonadaceae bacterium]|nr:hypothetical protein [Pyrinomonadaceae bacterium]
MASKLKPGMIVGAALGISLALTVLINVVTRVPFVGCCNCLWPIAAGLLATLWYIKGSPVPVTLSDGAIVGLIAGLVGGLIYVVLAIPTQYFIGSGVALMEAQVRQISPDFPLSGLVLLIIGSIIGFIVFLVLSIIGGLLAVPIFEKRKGNGGAPPPPQGYGGTPGGGYGSAA